MNNEIKEENKLSPIEIAQRNEVVVQQAKFQKLELAKMKKNLPRYLKKRKKEFAEKFQNYIDNNSFEGQLVLDGSTIPMFKIIQYTFKPIIKIAGASPAYTADEMAIAFDFYVDCTEKLNEASIYPPKIEDFCRLINISKSTFERYQTSSNDENMRELCNKIQDYCVARVADGAFASKDKAFVQYSMFHQKSSNKQRDNDPVQHNTLIQNNTIMSDDQYQDLANKFLTND